MEHVIIGTAGHIDHGKTTLIKALTGRDTDTLKEEKERGISINLGFTYFDLPSGRRAGIVDVPGHEKFIKNALAGIGGIDAVLLVIAGDEGIMPQTREHLNILELLDIKQGIVVITKADAVEAEWLNMVTEEIKKELNSTFLKNAPVIPVDSISGRGIRELTDKIDEITRDMRERDNEADFRIPVDRVFTISGFGTVVTGTLISGTLKVGDSCYIYTKEINSKIRNIQVHEQNVQTACSGQRVAINLANIKTGEIERGDVISRPLTMKNSMMLDCRLKYLKDAPRPLKNRDRVRVYHGTSETLGRVIILDKEEVNPGETALVQIRLESMIAAKQGDKYVIRSYSPLFTIGGGTILDPNPTKHKLKDRNTIDSLLIREKGTPEEIIEQAIRDLSSNFPKIEEIAKAINMDSANVEETTHGLEIKGKIHKLSLSEGEIFIHNDYLTKLKSKASELLEEYHRNHPLKLGMQREEFKNKVFGIDTKQRLSDKLLELLKLDTIDSEEYIVRKKGFKIAFNPKQEEISAKISKTFLDSGFQPPRAEDEIKAFGKYEKEAKSIFECLVDMGTLVKINDEIYISKHYVDKAKEVVINTINKNGDITLAGFRDELGTSRKYAVALLEYFDSIKFTKRIDDKRTLY